MAAFLVLVVFGFFCVVVVVVFVLFSDGKLLLSKMCVLIEFGLEK